MNLSLDNFFEEVKSICNYVRDEMNKKFSEIELRWRIRASEKEKQNIAMLDSLIKEMHEKDNNMKIIWLIYKINKQSGKLKKKNN